MEQNNKKLSTDIHGLDNLFHGGLHLEQIGGKDPNLMIVIRGEHGTNKIHLAMQMCEGLNRSLAGPGSSPRKKGNKILADQPPQKNDNNENKEMLFVSLNKDDKKIKEFYYDFYTKRLIRNIQIKDEGWNIKETIKKEKSDIQKIKGLFCLIKKRQINNLPHPLLAVVQFLSEGIEHEANKIQEVFASGVLYYNTRTHGLHIRQQTRNDDSNETQLLKINYKSNQLPKIEFWGRTKLNGKNEMADNRTIFFNLVQELEKKENKHFNCIMIDGLSMLTPEESEDCPINALIDLMRKKCTIGILNTNNNQSISKLDSDIVIDLRNRVDEITNHTKKELRIYKCLYQKNTYGWHQYKMRNAGVEVIPSLHKTLSRRNYIDESISEAMLSLDKMSYSYWLNENLDPKGPVKQDNDRCEIISKLAKTYNDFSKESTDNYKNISQGKLFAITSYANPEDALICAIDDIKYKNPNEHILFIDLKRSRKDFWEFIREKLNGKVKSFERLHYFGFRAGCIYADEFLYTLEQQVSAIAREIKEKEKETDNESQTKKQKYHYYKKVHIVMGDLNLLQYCYPCLYSEQLFIPTISALTKGNYMTNYLYMTDGDDSDGSNRIKRQLLAIADDEKPEKSLSKQGRTNNSESL